LNPQEKIKAVNVDENINYWHWVTPTKLGFVTSTSAYTININNQQEDKVKILDRTGAFQGTCQITGLKVSNDDRWALLIGISSPDQGKTILGHMQLGLIEANKSQSLEGHYGNFGKVYYHSSSHQSTIIAFFERKQGETTQRIHFNEISAPPDGKQKLKKQCEIQMPPQHPNDFPVYMHVSSKHGLCYVMTKQGFYFVLEIASASLVGQGKISNDPIFIGAPNSRTDGVLVINRSGQVLGLNTDENNLVKFIMNNCSHINNSNSVATTLAINYKLPGCENILFESFNKCFATGDYVGAARIAADSPGNSIRNADTIQKFKNAPGQPGQPQPILQYFSTLLEKTKLNALESVEIVGPVLNQGKKGMVEGWIQNQKLTFTEDLGNAIQKHDQQLALKVFEQCEDPNVRIRALMAAGRVNEAQKIAQESGVGVDWMSTIRQLVISNPEGALTTAKQAAKTGGNIYNIAEIFLSHGRIQELTGFLVEHMKENKTEDAQWQTKVLELNLPKFPQVAEAIFQMNIWKLYDRKKIASICEGLQLPKRALENYQEYADIRRVILNSSQILMNKEQEWFDNYLSKLDSENLLNICKDLLRQHRQNLQPVCRVCIANAQRLGSQNIIKAFESVGAFEGVYYFLGSVIGNNQDPELVYKYIEAAAKCNQSKDVERVVKDYKNAYDPEKVKNLLMEVKLNDPKPLMLVCDIHGYIEDLTKYLFKFNHLQHIEIYVIMLSNAAAPQVLGTLIDLEADEKFILKLLSQLRTGFDNNDLVTQFQKRNKLRLLESWIEARVNESNQSPALHNALAMIYIDTNKEPQNFLTNNPYYESKVVGKYAEEIDPHLAIIAYKKDWGNCDQELIDITNKYKLFRIQAKYLVERKEKELWESVLSEENPYRKDIIEQVVSSALPDSKNADEVVIAVQSFMEAKLNLELISLLEKIVLHSSEFSGYRKLQNLLIITAAESDKSRVMDYINRLDNYDADEIASVALGEEYQLYEEAFVIYKKVKKYVEAIDVLLNNIESIPRAAEFAERINEPPVWSRLGNAYLISNQVSEAIESFLKAKDPSYYAGVINSAQREEKYDLLTQYLLMARQTTKDAMIDSELLYCFAKTGKNVDLENFLSNPNSADLPGTGDRCFRDKLYEAAKVIFVNLKNNAKIASCLIRLKQYNAAFESAKKANTPKTWKELCLACVQAGEYKLANSAGMNIVIHPDHLDELIHTYEKYDVSDEMINLLEQAQTLDRTHIGIHTELGVLFAKYHPEQLMEHLRNRFQDLNISKLLRVCERYQLWPEAVYLYSHYNEFDNAINCMIEHSPSAYQHEQFVSLIQKVRNTDVYFKAVIFYLEE